MFFPFDVNGGSSFVINEELGHSCSAKEFMIRARRAEDYQWARQSPGGSYFPFRLWSESYFSEGLYIEHLRTVCVQVNHLGPTPSYHCCEYQLSCSIRNCICLASGLEIPSKHFLCQVISTADVDGSSNWWTNFCQKLRCASKQSAV